MSLMASLLKGKQMVQRRLGLYRRVLQGHKSDASTELPGVRQIQSCAKTTVVPLPSAQCFVLLSLKAVLDRGLLHESFLLLGVARFGMERVRASGCMGAA